MEWSEYSSELAESEFSIGLRRCGRYKKLLHSCYTIGCK